jgi:hypothetical protein
VSELVRAFMRKISSLSKTRHSPSFISV